MVATPHQLDLIEYLGGEGRRAKKSHLWKLSAEEHYVEEYWCNARLFQEEQFVGDVFDPCCGFGRIVECARAAGFHAYGSDIVKRSDDPTVLIQDFRESTAPADNLIFNPPFKLGREFTERALRLATYKVAVIVPVRRLNAMGKWLAHTPLQTIWLMTPRPSMPPGSFITAGGNDFCWCIFLQGYDAAPTIKWLHRDPKNQRGPA